jgi:chromate transporter
MLDGLGMAETTPGPLIMVLQFVGFMAAYPRSRHAVADAGGHARRPAGDLGHLHALLPLDLPRRAVHRDLRGNKGLAGALTAITAAVVGVILNLSIWFALHTVFRQTSPVRSFGLSFDMPVLSSLDVAALLLAIAAATAIFRFNMGMLCAAGVLLRLVGMI